MSHLAGIKAVDELELGGKRVFLRVDFNVPLDKSGTILSDARIRMSLPTIRYALEQGAQLILASHLGRPKGKVDPAASLEPAAARLSELLGTEVLLPDDCVGDSVKKVLLDRREGQVILLENLRFHPEEEANDEAFARQLAAFTDVYVNDAFGVTHRRHASLVTLPQLVRERGMGFLIQAELQNLDRIIHTPTAPFVAVLGGSKVTDKIGVIEALLERCQAICIGGAMANTLLAAKGYDMKASRLEQDWLPKARHLFERAEALGVALVLPVDVVVGASLDATEGQTVPVAAVPSGTMALDVGPETVEIFAKHIRSASTVFMNGPMGLYESAPFMGGTLGVARALADSSGYTVVGGGDSAAAIQKAGGDIAAKVSFISTGGGASLHLIEGKRLPGVDALRSKDKA